VARRGALEGMDSKHHKEAMETFPGRFGATVTELWFSGPVSQCVPSLSFAHRIFVARRGALEGMDSKHHKEAMETFPGRFGASQQKPVRPSGTWAFHASQNPGPAPLVANPGPGQIPGRRPFRGGRRIGGWILGIIRKP
jgi:hypothetical protein